MSNNNRKQNSDAFKQRSDAQTQAYDNIFKRLIEGQFGEIVPLLFSTLNPIVHRELTIEALLPPRRMDRVYLASTPVGKVILHIEVEMAPRGRDQTSRRILVYHSLLSEKYNKDDGEKISVITLVMYPFDVPGGEPVLIETYGDEEILRFYYREMSLRAIEAPAFVATRPIPLYGLLPAMSDVSLEILMKALDDMVKYYEGDDDRLRDEFLCFNILLNRAKPLPKDEMEQVLRRIRMYDPLLEEDPWVQEYAGKREAEGEARGEAKGRAEGIVEGKIEGKTEGMRQNIEVIVQVRFPDLRDSVMERVKQLHDPIALQTILLTLGLTPGDLQARHYLQNL